MTAPTDVATADATGDATVPGPVLRQVLVALEAAGVHWVVLRGRAQLAAPGHDVDLLLAAADLPRAEDVIFALGGVALPRRLHPWHRMYLLGPGAGGRILLDVVTEITFNRSLRVTSGIEDDVLARRWWDGTVHVLQPSDLFWTVLLHCLLDKQAFSPNRRAELLASVDELVPGSPGECCYTRLSPDGPAADEVVRLVASADWPALVDVGEDLVRRLQEADGATSYPPVAAAGSSARPWTTARGRVRSVLAGAYPHVWRRLGLGATPRAVAAAERAGVDVGGVRVVRRPLLCTAVLSVEPEDAELLRLGLRCDGFVPVGAAWHRMSATGLERVVVRSTRSIGEDSEQGGDMTVIRTARETPRRGNGARTRLVVSFSGLDGAGKTRQIDALVTALEARHPVDLRWLPFRIWPQGLLNRLPADFRSRLGPRRTTTPSPGRHRPRAASGAGTPQRTRGVLWRCIGTLAAVSGGMSLRREARPAGTGVLVLDRYRLDAIVKLQFWYPDVPGRWLAGVVNALAPAPDVEFLLRVDPEVAYARKPEQWSVDQLARQSRLYDGLAADRPEVVVLDAQARPDELAAAVWTHVERVLDGH